MNSDAAILVVMVLVGRELLSLATGYFFKKLTRDDYITKSDCNKCSKDDESAMRGLASDISTIKGLLLALAMNKDLTADDLTKLMENKR